MSARKDKTELVKKIKELEEKLKQLEEGRGKEGEAEGVAEGILEALGSIIPGLGGLVKSLAKSDEFRKRLKEIDEEIEERLRAGASKGVEMEAGVKRGPVRRSIPRKPPVTRKAPDKKYKAAPKVKPEAIDSEKFPVDIFDEEDHVRVVAEMPGLERDDVMLRLAEDQLTISAVRGKRKYHQVIALPSRASSIQEMTYRAGILEVLAEKA